MAKAGQASRATGASTISVSTRSRKTPARGSDGATSAAAVLATGGEPAATGSDGRGNKASTKQAVIIIHGMGEQRPMETLRGFVRAVWMDDYEFCRSLSGGLTPDPTATPEDAHSEVEKKKLGDGTWITPVTSRLAKTGVFHENIRITTGYHESENVAARPGAPIRTDFYEFYWADLMNSGGGSALRRWTAGLFIRPLRTVPQEVYALWVALWVMLIVVAGLFLLALPSVLPIPSDWTSSFLPEIRDSVFVKFKRYWPDDPVVIVLLLLALPAFNLAGIFLRDQLFWTRRRSAAAFLPVLIFHLVVAIAILSLVAGCTWLVANGYMDESTLFWSIATAIALLLIFAINQFYFPYFGDVARYVQSATDTVQQRQAIRERGLDLLRELHDDPEYSRIVIASHSLGSVIAYDLVRLLWIEYGATSANGVSLPGNVQSAFHAVADSIPPTGPTPATLSQFAVYRSTQKEAFLALRDAQRAAPAVNGRRRVWKVSDLVTFGSPLTHADFLMASDIEHLRMLQRERSFPKCPPVREDGSNAVPNPSGNDSYLYRVGSKSSGQVYAHHATPYCVVRWTNLYDWRRFAIWGDFVSGPLAVKFGAGILDFSIRMKNLSRKWFENKVVTHTYYWSQWASPHELAHNEDTIYGRLRQNIASAIAGRTMKVADAGSVAQEPVHLRLLRAAVDLKFGADDLCNSVRMFAMPQADADKDPVAVRGQRPFYLKGAILSYVVPGLLALAGLYLAAVTLQYLFPSLQW